MIRAIIFDCFGVLAGGDWKDFWTTLPSPELRSDARDLRKAYDIGRLTQEEFNQQLGELTGIPFSEIGSIFNNDNLAKNEQLLHYIRSLKPKYKIGLLSNVGSSWIEDKLLSPDEQSLFDAMVFSYRVSMAKPNPQIYLLIASKLKVDPSECVFVDDISSYCEVAGQLGMKTIVYSSFSGFKGELSKILSK
ncbi:MAG TPA: HAD family phosphatase [Candidatus Saccharimonadales bacterium]